MQLSEHKLLTQLQFGLLGGAVDEVDAEEAGVLELEEEEEEVEDDDDEGLEYELALELEEEDEDEIQACLHDCLNNCVDKEVQD